MFYELCQFLSHQKFILQQVEATIEIKIKYFLITILESITTLPFILVTTRYNVVKFLSKKVH